MNHKPLISINYFLNGLLDEANRLVGKLQVSGEQLDKVDDTIKALHQQVENLTDEDLMASASKFLNRWKEYGNNRDALNHIDEKIT